jgi:hypothetical protein
LKDIYTGEKFLRRRSARDAVAELAEARTRHGATEIMFEDEIFGMDAKWLRQFVPLYREQVGLPFSAYLYPTRNIDTLLPLLKEAGLTSCCISLQTGSERIHKQDFDRPYDRKLFLHTIRLCRALGIAFYTDVITFNPYEEESDLEKTLDVLLDIQGPYGLCIIKLFVLPGTTLAERMRRDGKDLDVSAKQSLFEYYCRLFSIASLSRFARPVVRMTQRVQTFRRRPERIPMGAIEFGLRVANAIHRRLPRAGAKPSAAMTPPGSGGSPELVVIGTSDDRSSGRSFEGRARRARDGKVPAPVDGQDSNSETEQRSADRARLRRQLQRVSGDHDARAGQRGDRVDVRAKDGRDLRHEHIPRHTASDAGQHA